MTEMNLEVEAALSDFTCTCVAQDCVKTTHLTPEFPVICENFSGIKKNALL